MEDMATFVVESVLTRVSSELIGSETDNFLLMEAIFESMLKGLVEQPQKNVSAKEETVQKKKQPAVQVQVLDSEKQKKSERHEAITLLS
jgi:hypothetical protein